MSDPYDPQLTLQENAAKQQKLRKEAEETATLRAQLGEALSAYKHVKTCMHSFEKQLLEARAHVTETESENAKAYFEITTLRAQLEAAKAALREAREFIAEECVRPEHEPAIPGSFADEAGKQLASIDAALEGKPAP